MAPTDVKRDMFLRVVVAIDPAGSNRKSADLTGIVVAGVTVARHAVVLEDLSGRYSPDEWARRAVEAYRRHPKGNAHPQRRESNYPRWLLSLGRKRRNTK